jgi:hypothetical protein
MDESPDRDSGGETGDAVDPEATDADVEAAVSRAQTTDTDTSADDDGAADAPPDPTDLPEGILNAPESAEGTGHTLLEEHERETEAGWKAAIRTGAFWLGATAVAVAVTLTAIVSLRGIGLSDSLSFILASVGMSVIVGLVFLSLQR